LRRVALVSARAARALDEDLPPLLAAFAGAGAAAEVCDWDDPDVDWGSFDAALLRSAWDYTERLSEFLAWVQRTASQTLLLNTQAVVHWNSDKHYLAELARQGLPVVPSGFCEPDDDAAEVLEGFLARHALPELVVKPAVGAGSRDTRRHPRTAVAEILAHVGPLLKKRRSVLLQPYLPSVDRDGETALIYIDGEFSHAIRKGPLLPAGAAATAALFAPEEITVRVPGNDERALAERVLAALPFPQLLYARIDLIRGEGGEPRLLELELTEPSLFFPHGPGSAPRLARGTLSRIAAHTGR
jgi:glutathione synthase/RimK-type ligase-like ATP-grasp enzyme